MGYIGSLIPHSCASSLSFLVNISGMTLNHIGEEIPPCLTPLLILKGLEPLLLIRSLLVPSKHISESISTVSSSHPRSSMVLYRIFLLIESNAFFKSMSHQ